MDDRKVGLIIRALRRRRGWRQRDLAGRAGVSQAVVSEIERGHIHAKQIRTVRRLLNALDADVRLEVRWRGGEADRLVDEDHARLGGTVAERLERLGWAVRTELTYSEYGERGAFDVLGGRAETGDLVVVEVKTELLSAKGHAPEDGRKGPPGAEGRRRAVRLAAQGSLAGARPAIVLGQPAETQLARGRLRRCDPGPSRDRSAMARRSPNTSTPRWQVVCAAHRAER